MQRRLVSLTVLAGLVTGLSGVAPAAAETAEEGEALVVEFEDGTTPAERRAALAARGLRLVDDLPGADFALAETDGSTPLGAATAAGGDADPVVDVEAPVPVRALAAPNDIWYPRQWNLPMVQASEAWDVTTGEGVVVAVVDSGVASRTGGGFTKAPDLATTRFAAGWDFVDRDTTPDDRHGHGTHVAGTIAQSTNNGIGVAGLAPGATIMPVRVLDGDGMGTDFRTAEGVRWAVDHGADVINLSLGGDAATSVMRDAVAYAAGRGVVVVAATGNDNQDQVYFPAAYPEVIAVGAVTSGRSRSSYSNTGPEVELVAPGGDIPVDPRLGTYLDGILQQTLTPASLNGGVTDPNKLGYYGFDGTSMATPHVSAAAALLLAAGASGPDQVRSALQASAADLGAPGRDGIFGYGLVQARAALDHLGARPKPPFVPGATARPIDRACPATTALPRGTFEDVAASDLHGRSVDCVKWWGVASGTSATTYNPAGTVRRDQMAAFIARMVTAAGHELPASPPDAFSDDDGSTHELRINQLAAAGVVGGTGGGRYSPSGGVSRAALATFLVKAHELVAGSALPIGADHFTDDQTSVHQTSINKAAQAGLTTGRAAGSYAPGSMLTRNQMASFLARNLDSLITGGHAAPRA